MGRLIDEDVLIEAILNKPGSEAVLYNTMEELDAYWEGCEYKQNEIIDMINNIPTAYDVDKVVEDLELHSFEFGTDILPAHYVRLNDAIEIVKQGGVDNDVCEWKKGSSGYVGYPAYYSKCCTTNSNGLEMQSYIIADWKFCPYCGKKIKIVGD